MRCVVIAMALMISTSANAAVWRYCVAQDEANRKVYVTDPFQSEDHIDALEHQFNTWLNERELAHTWGICPLAISSFGPSDDVKAALDYNKGFGMKGVRVDWRP